jgi:hypothetical protein
VWTAGAVLLERGMRTRPADAPPLAVIAATLRQMAREAMQQERVRLNLGASCRHVSTVHRSAG